MVLALQSARTQNRQGNIVEYFGKEKVNEISEGQLIHVFQDGLAVSINQGFNAPIDFPIEPIFNQFLNHPDYQPLPSDVFDIDSQGRPVTWKPIVVDSTGTFSQRSLRSAYVYLTYPSPEEKVVLFEASGHSIALINGYPHEGDHYDFGYSLIPIKLRKGQNTFVLKIGRFPRVRARLIEPSSPLLFTSRDMTLPDVSSEDNARYYGAIRVVNASESFIDTPIIIAVLGQKKNESEVISLAPLSVTKIPFETPSISGMTQDTIDIDLTLVDDNAQKLASTTVTLNVKSKYEHHKKTFVSNIDRSVQYYSVAPSLNKDSSTQALFLSVHGASVEATNQARAYKRKDWGTLVAPTNRRPFGFAWEDWGRMDALEVLADAKSIYQPDPQRIYLTGHSMGGHGTWYLSATYPDHFAAIAPCAGYPDLLEYRKSFVRRLSNMSATELERFGMTPEMVKEMNAPMTLSPMDKMVKKGGHPSRTLTFSKNYLHHGVYILHGEKDNVVPTFIARDMRQHLGGFHNDFVYYEYPEGTHWYGDHSVDWPPIFDFFKQRAIPEDDEIKNLQFLTASPGISASSHHISITQQVKPLEISSFNWSINETYALEFTNTESASLDFSNFKNNPEHILVDGQRIDLNGKKALHLQLKDTIWNVVNTPDLSQKGPHRYGGFKDAFNNDFVMVYGTKGSKTEHEWNQMKAMFDAETFSYRANGYVEVIADTDFSPEAYIDRNVVLYGNKDNNSAWELLLYDCPVQFSNDKVSVNGSVLLGPGWASYFIYPRPDSDVASVGVVTTTGLAGMKAAFPNHYLVNGTSFPDFVLFDESVLEEGINAVKAAGFFGNDWSVENGEFEWR